MSLFSIMENSKLGNADYTPDFGMVVMANRLATFKDWPFNDTSRSTCTAEKMAEAGFYHVGENNEPDLVKCFVCFKELDGWEPEDDPWAEHRSHSKACAFLSVGKDFGDMTMTEYINLEKARNKNRLLKASEAHIKEFQELAGHTRREMEKLVK